MQNQSQKPSTQSKRYNKIGPYILSRVIGRGAYSTVYEGYHESQQKKKYAIKQTSLQKLNKKQRERIKLQIKVLSEIKHRNIVYLVDFKQTIRNMYLIFQYCKYTDLDTYVQNYTGGKLSEQNTRKISIQIKNAFQVLRAHKVVHRDLKLANILMTQDCEIKISDFGFAKYLDDDQFFRSYVGTPLTMAPQIMYNLCYNQKCDLWSLGIMIYQLLFGKNPFFQKDTMTKCQIKNAIKNQLKIPEDISPIVKDLLKKMIVIEPHNRISFQQFFTHPWLCNNTLVHSIDNNNNNFYTQVLKIQLKKISLLSNRKKEQKQLIQNNIDQLLVYEIIQNIINIIENKIINWINLGKKIINMDLRNRKLGFFGICVLIQNIINYQDKKFCLVINQDKRYVINEYREIRKLQKWELTQYSKQFPNFLQKSTAKLFQYARSFKDLFPQFDPKYLDTTIEQLYLLQYIQQISKKLNNKNELIQIYMLTKIKLQQTNNIFIKITSNLINNKIINLLINQINFNVKYQKIFKNITGIFKIYHLHRDQYSDRIYQNIKMLLE